MRENHHENVYLGKSALIVNPLCLIAHKVVTRRRKAEFKSVTFRHSLFNFFRDMVLSSKIIL